MPDALRRQAGPIARALDALGFRSRVRVFDDFAFDGRLPPQLAVNGWIADGPDSAAFLRALVSCKPHAPGDEFPHLCGYGVDAAIDRAQAAGPAAGDAWKRIEDLIAAHAPVVPLLNRRAVAVISKQAGNFVSLRWRARTSSSSGSGSRPGLDPRSTGRAHGRLPLTQLSSRKGMP